MAFRPLAPLMALAALAACGGDAPPPGPTGGEVVVSLSSPNTQDGALVVRLTGPLTDLTAVGGYRIASSVQGAVTQVVITGTIVSGDILRFKVADLSLVPGYGASVTQVARRTDYALLDVAGYTLTLRAK
jgi:hypothetical protein